MNALEASTTRMWQYGQIALTICAGSERVYEYLRTAPYRQNNKAQGNYTNTLVTRETTRWKTYWPAREQQKTALVNARR